MYDQVKQSPSTGDVVDLGLELTDQARPFEVQLIGYQLLEHVVSIPLQDHHSICSS